eukprot:scaffold101590_cov19-Prasinocladus_malaysianus.AAC.3
MESDSSVNEPSFARFSPIEAVVGGSDIAGFRGSIQTEPSVGAALSGRPTSERPADTYAYKYEYSTSTRKSTTYGTPALNRTSSAGPGRTGEGEPDWRPG